MSDTEIESAGDQLSHADDDLLGLGEINPELQEAMELTGDPAAMVLPKKRGRKSNAERAAMAAAAGSQESLEEQSINTEKETMTVTVDSPAPTIGTALERIDAAVGDFLTHNSDVTWIIAAIADWLPAPAYRKFFHSIAHHHGEAAVYAALAHMAPNIQRSKRSGMALGASMAASSARCIPGKSIDMGQPQPGMYAMPTLDIANRYARLTREEMLAMAR